MPRTETRRSTSSSSESLWLVRGWGRCLRWFFSRDPSWRGLLRRRGRLCGGLACGVSAFLRRGSAAVAAEGFDAAEDGGGGFAGDGLVGDGFEEGFVGGLRVGDIDLEGSGVGDEALQAFVAIAERW